jgi:tetraacyldisaccharide 4'-kinase
MSLGARAERAIERIWYGGSAWRWPLLPLSLAFYCVSTLRRAAYRTPLKQSIELPAPVVVVGNLTAGGTGKTPFVIWLAEQLTARGWSPGIVARGYGGRAKTWPQRVRPDSSPDLVGDEPVLLAMRTGLPIVVGPDRVAAARALLAGGDVDVVLSDDGLQHYRLARTYEIAVVDGLRGFGNGWCLPAGPLREPASRLRTVDAVVVNRGGSEREPAAAPLLEASLSVPMTLAVSRVYRVADGAPAQLEAFAGRTVHAVAGIGNPERFFAALERAGLGVLRHPLRDHARIDAASLPREPGVPVLLTEKDAVKCRGVAHDDVWCVAVDADVDSDAAARLLDALTSKLNQQRGRRRAQ